MQRLGVLRESFGALGVLLCRSTPRLRLPHCAISVLEGTALSSRLSVIFKAQTYITIIFYRQSPVYFNVVKARLC